MQEALFMQVIDVDGLLSAVGQSMQCCARHVELLSQSIQRQLCNAPATAAAQPAAFQAIAEADLAPAADDDSGSPRSPLAARNHSSRALFDDSPGSSTSQNELAPPCMHATKSFLEAHNELIRSAACLSLLVSAVCEALLDDAPAGWTGEKHIDRLFSDPCTQGVLPVDGRRHKVRVRLHPF
jgi:hypothetical protein